MSCTLISAAPDQALRSKFMLLAYVIDFSELSDTALLKRALKMFGELKP
ncbi:hypothetical protein [Paraburkholderia dipogonis]|nr:hypothetical protein [Paraburkholderia dipogonis]